MDAIIVNILLILFSFITACLGVEVVFLPLRIWLIGLDIKNKINYNDSIMHVIMLVISVILSICIYYEFFIDVY